MNGLRLNISTASVRSIPRPLNICRISTMSTEASKKRKARDVSISPPPTRVKVRSTTTKNDVASFFTPQSQKPTESVTKKTIWQQRSAREDTAPSLLVGKYQRGGTSSDPTTKRRKIAAFDFDDTLVRSSSGKKFTSDPNDWKWWHSSVPEKLRKLYNEEGYQVIIISNQAGISFKTDQKTPKSQQNRLAVFKTKASAVLSQLDLGETSLYAATEKDVFRKPRPGMWKEMVEDYDLDDTDGIDLANSFFVGDAAGRIASAGKPKDFSCSDRDLAHNLGVRFITPEEYFLGEEPRSWTRDFEPAALMSESTSTTGKNLPPKFSKANKQDLIIFVGSPGSGKSTFYWKQLKPLGYERVNQDLLKTRDKCLKVAQDMLSNGKSVAVDNTNPDVPTRAQWIKLAAKYNIPIRCVVLTSTLRMCEHNDAVRALNPSMNPENRSILPKIAFTTFNSRFQKPSLDEGLSDITEVEFQFDGNEAEREVWSKYWT